MIAGLGSLAAEPARRPAETTVIVGFVRKAGTWEPVTGAALYTSLGSEAARTDSVGYFTFRTARTAGLLGVGKDGFLAFEYPLLQLVTDTLRVEIELRTDPPGSESYATAAHLRYLCVVVDAPNRLAVRNTCETLSHPASEYTRRIIKHNPWSPYFGPAVDKAGVLILTRAAADPSE
jgi:hypothetical protein